MESLAQLILDKGPLFGAACIAVMLALYLMHLILRSYEKRFEKFDEKFQVYDSILSNSTSSMKTVSRENIQQISLESASIRAQMDSLGDSVKDLKTQVTKEMLGLKSHSMQLQERSEKLREYVDESMGKVGRVLDMKEKLDITAGNMQVLEVKINRIDQHHRTNMTTVAEAIGKQGVKISNLEKKEKP